MVLFINKDMVVYLGSDINLSNVTVDDFTFVVRIIQELQIKLLTIYINRGF